MSLHSGQVLISFLTMSVTDCKPYASLLHQMIGPGQPTVTKLVEVVNDGSSHAGRMRASLDLTLTACLGPQGWVVP